MGFIPQFACFAQSFRIVLVETPLDCTNVTDFTHYANLFSRLGMAVSAEQLPWDTPQLLNSCWVTVRMWRGRIR